MMYGTDGYMWGGWILMGAVMVMLSAVLITGVVLAVQYLAGSDAKRSRVNSAASSRPEDVLAQRFAHGDIDEDEFRRRMTLLREHQESR